MNETIHPWYDAEISYRAERIKAGTGGTRTKGPRSGRRRGRVRDRGSWETWRSMTLAG